MAATRLRPEGGIVWDDAPLVEDPRRRVVLDTRLPGYASVRIYCGAVTS